MIQTQSATRVDLAGGTLDCWPLYLLVDGAITTNVSISIFTQVELKPRQDTRIHLTMEDLQWQAEYSGLNDLMNDPDPTLRLVQKHLYYWQPRQGFHLTTRSQSPVGGGLGASSSLSMSLNKAFSKWLSKELELQHAIQLSANIEAQVLGKMTGTQDYFAAVAPGLNAIHYTADGFQLERLKFDMKYWNSRMSLVYTGQPHNSGLNNWKVIQAALDGEKETLTALNELKVIADDTYIALKAENWGKLGGLFDREFRSRCRLAQSFSSPEIERLNAVALKSGAQAVKICGAGGGGCVLVWSEPDAKKGVESACRDNGFHVLPANAVA